MSLVDKSIIELSRVIHQKEVKPSEVAKAFLAHYEETKETGAFAAMDGDAVLRRAEELDRIPVTPDTHPIFGIPVAIKDNIATKSLPTACGSKMLENFRPPYDAEVVTRLLEKGAVIFGKINMDEFDIGSGVTPPSAFGAITDPRLASSDAIGCGVTPSYGAVSREGLFACAGSFDRIGTVARTVADAALLAGAISELSLDIPSIGRFSAEGKRIGVLGECERVCGAAEVYKSLGAEVETISVPLAEYAPSIYGVISFCEISSNFSVYDGIRFGRRAEGETIDDVYVNSRSQGFGAEVRRGIWLGTYMLGAENYERYYKRARIAQDMLKDELEKAFERCDVLLAPVNPSADAIANISGLPTVAAGNLRLIGKLFDDAALLPLAHALEVNGGVESE